MRSSASSLAHPPPLPSVVEEELSEGDYDDESDGSDGSSFGGAAEEAPQPAPSLTRQLGLPPVRRRPLHWQVVRPRGGGGGGVPARSAAATADNDSEDARRGGGVIQARHCSGDGGGVLSSFARNPDDGGVPSQIGLTSRRGRRNGAASNAVSSSNGGGGDGTSTVHTGATGTTKGTLTTCGSHTTVSSLHTAPSLSDGTAHTAKSDGSSWSLLDRAFAGVNGGNGDSKKSVSFQGAAASTGAGRWHHRHKLRRGGGSSSFVGRALSDRHRNRTLMVLSAAAIVGASLSVLTLPSSSSVLRGGRSLSLGGVGSGGRTAGRTLFTLETWQVDRYPFSNFADTTSVAAEERELRKDDAAKKKKKKNKEEKSKKPVAFYWQVPRSGGTTFKHVMGSCLGLVQASRTSRDYCDVDRDGLELCDTKFGTFVNVDPSDDPGIRRGRELGLVKSGLADVVVSSRFLHSAGLFDTEEGEGTGRAFTVLRHPVDRSLSTFRYLQNAHWERNYNPEFKSLSVVEWTKRPDTATDWTVRWLTGKNHEGELSRDDLEFAKEVLRRKFLVLLTDDLVSGVDRLVRYMGWETTGESRKCARAAAERAAAKNTNAAAAAASSASTSGGAVAAAPPPGSAAAMTMDGDGNDARLDENSDMYRALAEINKLDIELYEYARALYVEQWKTVFAGGEALKMRGVPEEGETRGVGAGVAGAGAAPDAARIAAKFGNMMSTDKALRAAEEEAKNMQSQEGKDGGSSSNLPLPPDMAKLASQFDAVEEDEDAERPIPMEKKDEEAQDTDANVDDASANKMQDQSESQSSAADVTAAAAAAPDRAELPVPPEMARLAAQFDPVDDMDLDGLLADVDGRNDKKSEEEPEKPREDDSAVVTAAAMDGIEGDQEDGQDPMASPDDEDLVDFKRETEDDNNDWGRRDDLPVPPEMARLAAAFES